MAPQGGGAAGRRAQRPLVLYHLGQRIREKLAGSPTSMDRPVLDLTWDYPTDGPTAEPSADAVLARDQRLEGPTARRCRPTRS